MRHVRLGRTGLSVSCLCLGTMTFGLQCDEAASCAILARAAAGGVTFLDTAVTLGTAASRYQDRYWHEREFDTIEALRPLAAEAGMSLTRLAVAWVLAEPVITPPIVGASRPDQLDDVLPAAEKPLHAGLKARLDEITREYRWGDDPR